MIKKFDIDIDIKEIENLCRNDIPEMFPNDLKSYLG